MKEQLLKIIETEGLTPAKLADEIGVQRSGISHILSGRNKPSYDFILKILKRFSGINAEWLMTGEGAMIKTAQIPSNSEKSVNNLFDNDPALNQSDYLKNTTHSKQKLTRNSSQSIIRQSESFENKKGKDIKEFTNVNEVNYILVFYNDGTFDKYNSRRK